MPSSERIRSSIRMSVITDELSSDLDTALELARDLGFEGIELRGVGAARFPAVTSRMQERVVHLVREAGLPVVSMSPGLFKIEHPLPWLPESQALEWAAMESFDRKQMADSQLQHHLNDLLTATLDAALELGCPLINVFAFLRPARSRSLSIPSELVTALRTAAKRLASAGLVMSIENEFTTWAATSQECIELVNRINEPNVGVTWDPANAYRAGESKPYPDGYDQVRARVRHVHFKNARTAPQTGEPLFDVDGVIDWRGQIRALISDGFSGSISVETHQRPKLRATRQYLDQLRQYVTDAAAGA